VDIPKHSTSKSLFRYTREIKQYVTNHSIKNRHFDDKEITQIFISHLDEPRYKSVIKECQAVILQSRVVNVMYLVLAISDTINQLEPSVSNTGTPATTIFHLEYQNDQIHGLL